MKNNEYRQTINFNPIRFKTLIKYLKPKKGEKILDIGCSRGFYVREMEKYTKEIRGVDIDRISLKKSVTKKVEYSDAASLNFKENTFDKVYSLHTIEHTPDLTKFFKEIEKVLKPGGKVVIAYPYEPILGIQAIGAAIEMYGNPFMARKIHLHKVNPKKIKEIIKNMSFSHIESKLTFNLLILFYEYFTVLRKNK